MRSGQRPRSASAALRICQVRASRARPSSDSRPSANRSSWVEPSARGIASSIVVRRLAGERMQVRERQTAPRRTQHRQPRSSIRDVHQGARQCDQVLHDRPVAQLFDLDRLKVDTRCRELACDRIHVSACRDENRDAPVGGLFERVAHDRDHARGLDVFVGVDERVDVHAAAARPRRSRCSGCTGLRPAPRRCAQPAPRETTR